MTISDTYRIEWNHPKRGWEEITVQNSELQWVWEAEEGEVYFRKTLATDLVLKDTEFEELIKIERSKSRCKFLEIRFEKKCDGTWYEWFSGRIHIIDGDYDLNNCVIRIGVRPYDEYSCLKSHWEDEVNVLEEVGALEARHAFGRYKIYTNVLWSRYLPNASTKVYSFWDTQPSSKVTSWKNDGFAGERGFFLDDIDYDNTTLISAESRSSTRYISQQGDLRFGDISPDDDPTNLENASWIAINVYAYEVYEAECDGATEPDPPPGSEWAQIGTPSCPDTFYWYRPLKNFYCNEGNYAYKKTRRGTRNLNPFRVTLESGEDVMIFYYGEIPNVNEPFSAAGGEGTEWFEYSQYCRIPTYYTEQEFRGEGIYNPITLDNGIDFNSVLQYFTDKCGFTLNSNFFGINTDTTSPDNSFYTYAENNLQNLSLFQLTDISNPFAEENATIARVKFKDLLEDLKVLFNVYYEIKDNVFRLEHLSHFKNQYKVDLTAAVAKYIRGKKTYSYNEPEFPKFEEWRFALDSDRKNTQAFDGKAIEYNSACIGEDEETRSFNAPQIVTNFIFFGQNEQFQEQDELFLLATDSEEFTINYPIQGTVNVETRYAKDAINALTGERLINSQLAIPNLLENLHTFGRPQEYGILNDEDTQFTAFVFQRQGEEISFPMCCSEIINDFEPSDLFKSYLGWGEVTDVSYTEPLGLVKITLKYQ